jgi:endonuclease/exonuclease/phosphatase family metal-dependent hydrolase
MAFVYQPNLSAGPCAFGNLVLTKFTILEARSHRLTSVGEQRGLLEVKVAAPEAAVTVFCTHWGLSADERAVQAAETAALVNASAFPKLVCGDLNDVEESPSVAGFLSSASLRDLARDAGAPAPTFPSDAPAKRIDYVLGTADVRAVRAAVVDSPASDHRPVVVEVELSAISRQPSASV